MAVSSRDFVFKRFVLGTCCLLAIMRGFLFPIPPTFTGEYLVDHWDTSAGLPSNVIHSIAQTPDGYLWLATHKGLVRFDGITFHPVQFAAEEEKRTGKTAVPQSLYLDNNKDLWIGSSIGLTSYNFRTRRFKTYSPANSPGLPYGVIRRIYEDNSGNIWLGFVSNYLARFSPSRGVFTSFGAEEGLTGNIINAILENGKGRILIGTRNNGLFAWDTTRAGNFVKKPDIHIDGYLVSIHRDHNNVLWLCTTRGLLKNNGKSVKTYSERHGLSSLLTTAVLEDDKNQYWIGTEKGLDILRHDIEGNFKFSRAFSSSAIVSLFKDRENSVWVGTYDTGLKRLKPARFKSFSPLGETSREVLFSMFRESNGDVLLGTTTGSMYRLNKNRELQPFHAPELSGTGISVIYRDTHGCLWLATNGNGVYKCNRDTFSQYSKKNGLSHDLVTSVMEDSKANLWFGTHGGTSVWDNNQARFFTLTREDGLAGKKIHHIHEDQNGNFWIACDKGLSLLAGGVLSNIIAKPLIKNYLNDIAVTWIYEDSSPPPEEGPLLWLATNGAGMKRLKVKDGHVTNYNVEHGLTTSFIYRFFGDGQGYFWCQSDYGILRIDKSSLNRFATGEEKQILCISFDQNDGIKNPEFNNPFPRHTAFETPENELWFLNNKEIYIANPGKIRINTIEPPVIIEELVVGGNPVSLPVEPDDNIFKDVDNIRIHFNATTLLSSHNVVFRYRLSGVDDDWRYLSPGKRRFVEYRNLVAGRYEFKVTARNSDGIWNSSGASITFILKGAFFKSGLFLYLVLPVIFILIAVIVFLKVRQRGRKARSIPPDGQSSQEYKKTDAKSRQPKESSLHPDFVQTVINKLMHFVEVEKVFLDENLTMPSLAEKLSIHRYQLSQVLNEELNRSFPDFINYYRIEEAKKILEGPKGENTKISSLLRDVGFNTETAFYKAFKKYTGITPNQYKKKAKKKNTKL